MKDLMEEYGSAVSLINDYVCDECFDDSAISAFVRENAETNQCDFCGREGSDPIAACLADVVRYMESCLYREYDDAANVLGWDSAEGGYLGETWDGYEILEEEEVGFPKDESDQLLAKIAGTLNDTTWSARNPYGLSRLEAIQFSWDQFCDLIKYRERFFFLRNDGPPDSEDVLSPARVLDGIASICLTLGLFRTVEAGDEFFRVRKKKDATEFKWSTDFGPPPREAAIQSNRMNPPGIPMLYVSTDPGTALAETFDGIGDYVGATLRLLRPLRILDLTSIPPVPSIFLAEPSRLRWQIQFLRKFAWEISRPTARDDRTHIDYVPPQVVTEYFRNVFVEDGRSIQGIAFSSARRSDAENLVLFATQDEIVSEVLADVPSREDRPTPPDEGAWFRVVGVTRYSKLLILQWIGQGPSSSDAGRFNR